MKAIRCTCKLELALSPAQLCEEILRLENWPGFTGYGLLPGIRKAEFLQRSEAIVGTRIAVSNTDGSTHVEEILSWDGSKLVMRMDEFSPPVSRIADHFEEHWLLEPQPNGLLRVTREFHLYPLHIFGSLALRLIAPLLERAASQHMQTLAQAASVPGDSLPGN